MKLMFKERVNKKLDTGWVLFSEGELGHGHIHYIQVSRSRHTQIKYSICSDEPLDEPWMCL